MDEWDVDAVVGWFHAVGYTQYDKSIKEHQVISDDIYGSDGRVSPEEQQPMLGAAENTYSLSCSLRRAASYTM